MNSVSNSRIDLSIVMCYRNEGSEPLTTIASILETCENSRIEILAIDDAGDETPEISRYPQVRYFRSKQRTGVPACRDAGVAAARSENILSIDAHMRFRNDNWLEKGLAAIEENPQSIFCTTSVDISS
ncbi:MAG: glycosyltransferase, partial [Candidatus Aminicenantes bacterium]|nr:glycosyltransferase [Candidatus Aminicenantes bacterium]